MGNTYPITIEESRIVDSQQIATGPTHLQALERALGELIDMGGNGVAFGTEIEKAPFAVNSYGWLLGSAAHAQAPGIGGAPKTEQGLRLLDTTNNSQALLVVNDGYLEVYEDGAATPDYDTTPSWGTRKNAMDLSTGQWELSSGVGCSLYKSSQTITSGAGYTAISWGGEHWDTDSFWSSGTNITIPSNGVYLLSAYIKSVGACSDDALFGGVINIPAPFTAAVPMGQLMTNTNTTYTPMQSGSWIAPLSAAQVITCDAIFSDLIGGGTLNVEAAFSCFKLGDIT
jgi:hypothetical protein